MNKEMRKLIKTLIEEGWQVKETRKGVALYPANKRHDPIVVHGTESDHRAMKNTLARIRKARV